MRDSSGISYGASSLQTHFIIQFGMIDISRLQIRQLVFSQFQTLVAWAGAEGWNPGVNDAEIFWGTDPLGFVGCFYDNELIAGGSIVSYSGDFGFMGFFIVNPQHRGLGVGRYLWLFRRDALLARLKPGASIGMDGVVAMQPFYTKGGFSIAFRDERYGRQGGRFDVSSNISPIQEDDMPVVLSYDEQCFGFQRPGFMGPWLAQAGAKSFKFAHKGIVQGFAVIRKAIVGYKIGPLFADTPIVAKELYKACLNAANGDYVTIDIPVVNTGAIALVKEFDAGYVFECARMYYGHVPKQDIDKVFGITSFELG